MAKPNKTKRRVVRLTKRILLIVGALLIIAVILRALLPKPVAVDAAVVTRGPLEVEVREDGQTRVRNRYTIAAPVTGELERISVRAGTWVDAGAVVALIHPPRAALLDVRTRSETKARLAAARAREQQAVAAIARAREALDFATKEARRTRTLLARGAVTGAERERTDMNEEVAADELAGAEHERAAAAAEVVAIGASLAPRADDGAEVKVVAPSRGDVLRVMHESAGPVTAGTPLLELGDPSSLEIVVDVLSRDAERIKPGMRVEIGTAAREPLRGVVTLVEPSAFTRVSTLGVEEQRVNVIVRFDSTPAIGDGYRVDARIILWRGDDVLRIPSSALFRDHGQWSVYVLSRGRARTRTVDIGHRGRTDVEITGGLRAGERVILQPSDRIREDTRVSVR